MTQYCDDPECTDDRHWPGGCVSHRKRCEAEEPAPRFKGFSEFAKSGGFAAVAGAFSGLGSVAQLRLPKAKRGDSYAPCRTCGKRTRGELCFKCTANFQGDSDGRVETDPAP